MHSSPASDALAQRARELGFMIERLRESRSWLLARRIQRRLDVARRHPGADRLAQLGEQVLQLAEVWEAEGVRSARASGLLERIRTSHRAFAGGEILRAIRLIGQLRDLALRRTPVPGPAEEVAARIEALSLFAGLPGPATVPSDRPLRTWKAPAGKPVVDILVPIYGALEQTLRCLASVRRATPRTLYELVVIDDSGGDVDVVAALDASSDTFGFTRITNAHNEGYVASIQRGIALHPERDVVLLNSDAFVHGDWLDRLRAAAYSDWRVGTVTPWSNDGELTSHPVAGNPAPAPDDEELGLLDEAAARALAGTTATLPTAVGFCTYLRRACLEAVGDFDVQHFGRGYGEENDFSTRARQAGWRNVLAADVYVAHVGGSSFGAQKHTRREAAQRTLEALHPSYRRDVEDFVRNDSLRPLRRSLDIELVNGDGDAILLVSQPIGGGTARHVADLARVWEAEGTRAYWLHPPTPVDAEGRGVVRLERPAFARITPNLSFVLPDEAELLLEGLRRLRVGHVHYHHTLGLPGDVLALPDGLGVAYDLTVHDYFAICPRIHLVGMRHRYCGEPDVDGCCECLATLGSPVGRDVDVSEWRDRAAGFLARARRIFVPAEDVAKRLARYFPGADFTLRPHWEPAVEACLAPVWTPGETLRVAVIGALDVRKGSQVLEACIEDANARDLPIEFHVIGHTDRDDALRSRGRVRLHGPYEETRVYERLADLQCHRALVPSVSPETYCYSLTIALNARLHPVAFDLGAVAERIRDLGWGTLLELSADAARVNDALLDAHVPAFPEDAQPSKHRYANLCDDYYEGPFR